MRQIGINDEFQWPNADIGSNTGTHNEGGNRGGLPVADSSGSGAAAGGTSAQPPITNNNLPFGYGNADGWTASEQAVAEDALRHVTAQFQRSSPASSPTAVGAPSRQPPAPPPSQASVDPETPTPLGQVVMQKPVEPSQETTPNPPVPIPTPRSSPSGQAGGSSSSSSSSFTPNFIADAMSRFSMGSGAFAETHNAGAGFSPLGAIPGFFSGANGPYMGGGELWGAEANHGQVMQNTWDTQRVNNAVGQMQAAAARGSSDPQAAATVAATLRNNPEVTLQVSVNGTSVELRGEAGARFIEG